MVGRIRWRRQREPALLQLLLRLVFVRLAPGRLGFTGFEVERVLVLTQVVVEEVVVVRGLLFNGVLDVVEVLAGRAHAVVEGVVVFCCRP